MNWNPSPDQARAVAAIAKRLERGELVTRLGGLAGTGKTRLMAHLPASLGLDPDDVLYLTPTNLAAHVLRRKLVAAGVRSQVQTLFSKRYHAPEEYHCRDCPGKRACHAARNAKCGCWSLVWVQKYSSQFALAIVDEASMVRHEQYQDLLDFGMPLLFVGDPGQLRPIESDRRYRNFSVLNELDVELTRIHRQGKESLIRDWALRARSGRKITHGFGDDLVSKEPKSHPVTGESVFEVLEWDPADLVDSIVLCFRNSTRQRLNRIARRSLGFGSEPQRGDRVVCLDNIRRDRVYNGMRGTVISCLRGREGNYRLRVALDGEGRVWEGVALGAQFGYLPAEGQPHKLWSAQSNVWHWDYAYALTVHNAQGSEWRDVMLFDEYVGRERRNWLYTGITRAAESLTIVG